MSSWEFLRPAFFPLHALRLAQDPDPEYGRLLNRPFHNTGSSLEKPLRITVQHSSILQFSLTLRCPVALALPYLVNNIRSKLFPQPSYSYSSPPKKRRKKSSFIFNSQPHLNSHPSLTQYLIKTYSSGPKFQTQLPYPSVSFFPSLFGDRHR